MKNKGDEFDTHAGKRLFAPTYGALTNAFRRCGELAISRNRGFLEVCDELTTSHQIGRFFCIALTFMRPLPDAQSIFSVA